MALQLQLSHRSLQSLVAPTQNIYSLQIRFKKVESVLYLQPVCVYSITYRFSYFGSFGTNVIIFPLCAELWLLLL